MKLLYVVIAALAGLLLLAAFMRNKAAERARSNRKE